MAPSPTADAGRFTEPWRVSPAANMPDNLSRDSRGYGQEASHPEKPARREGLTSAGLFVRKTDCAQNVVAGECRHLGIGVYLDVRRGRDAV